MKTQVASHKEHVENLKVNPDEVTEDRIIDEYHQSEEFHSSLVGIGAPQWQVGHDSCLRFQQEKGVVIPEGSSVYDFWAAHTIGYPEYAIEDEEEVIDNFFLESPKKDPTVEETNGRGEGESKRRNANEKLGLKP